MNKKKFMSLILAVALLLTVLSGCGGGSGSSTGSGSASGEGDGGSSATAESSFDADAVAKGVKVTSYTYKVYDNYYLVLVLKNTVADCELNISVDFLDGNGEIVGVKDSYVSAFAKDTETALTFSCDQKFAKFEYTLEPKEIASYYAPVTQDLTCEAKIVQDKAIISVTNNGKVPAQFVEYNAIFFKGDKVVYSNCGYVGDSDNEIKAGDTKRDEAACYGDFDSVKVYLNSRADAE